MDKIVVQNWAKGKMVLGMEPNYQTMLKPKYPKDPVKLDNIDQATYYILKGAVLVGVKARRVAENKRSKLGYTQHWYVFLEKIKPSADRIWKEGKAAYPIKEFMVARKHLKQKIKSYIFG